jgi:hypothetical protein
VKAPAFDDTGLSTAAGNDAGTETTEVYMTAAATGRLVYDDNAAPQNASLTSGADTAAVARLIKYHSDSAIEVELLV